MASEKQVTLEAGRYPMTTFEIDLRSFQDSREIQVFSTARNREELLGLTRLVVEDMIDNPPDQKNAATGKLLPTGQAAWHRIRSKVVATDGTTADEVLSRPSGSGPYAELDRAILLVLSLRERHAHLVQQLARLDTIEAAFGAPVGDRLRARAEADHRTAEVLAAAGGAR